jgi:glycine oxidase
MAHPDVLIIGGGVIGASIAYHLAERGARVALIERGGVGGNASLAGAGLIHPLVERGVPEPLRTLSAASFALYPDLVARLREGSGIDPQFQISGWLRVAMGDAEGVAPTVHAREYGARSISGEEARTLEPALSSAVTAAIHLPHGAQVYAPALLQSYLYAAARLGVTVRRGMEVRELCLAADRVTGARTTDGEVIAAGHTVLAGGAWSSQLTEPLGHVLPVYPVRGQSLSLYAIPAPFRQVVFGAGVYLAPKVDGSLLVAATYEDAGFDARLTAAGVGGLLDSALTLAPALGDATFRHSWVGLRPVSRDGLPFLGPLPGRQGLSVATGHGTEGIMLSPITGLLMAQSILGLRTDPDLAPFSPERVGDGSPQGTSGGYPDTEE